MGAPCSPVRASRCFVLTLFAVALPFARSLQVEAAAGADAGVVAPAAALLQRHGAGHGRGRRSARFLDSVRQDAEEPDNRDNIFRVVEAFEAEIKRRRQQQEQEQQQELQRQEQSLERQELATRASETADAETGPQRTQVDGSFLVDVPVVYFPDEATPSSSTEVEVPVAAAVAAPAPAVEEAGVEEPGSADAEEADEANTGGSTEEPHFESVPDSAVQEVSGGGSTEAVPDAASVPDLTAQQAQMGQTVAKQQEAAPHNQWLQRAKMYQVVQSRFANRPPPQEWQPRLADGIQRGREAGCAADVPFTANEWGFGSKINNLVNVLWVAVYLGASMAWRLPDDFAQPWFQHFDNKLGFAVERCSPNKGDWEHYTRLYVDSRMWAEQLTAVDGQYMADMKRFLTGQLWTLKAETLSVINSRLTDAGLQQGTKYIGVHIRRGDKGEEAELLPVSQYADSVLSQAALASSLAQLETNSSTRLYFSMVASVASRIQQTARLTSVNTVYLASDDPSTLGDLQKALGEQAQLRVLQAPEAGRQECNFGTSGKGCHFDEDDPFISLLTDIEAMRRSSTFIGTASSNLGRLVYFLRRSDQPSISLDDDNNFMKLGG